MTWPKVKLGEVLKQVHRREKVDPEKSYRLLGVRLEGAGPFLRETVSGTATSAACLSQVKAGDFIYSRLFAWRGAFGRISSDLDGCYVSNEFPTFIIDPERADARFLELWFRLKPTIDAVAEKCTGSTPLTRNRFKENFFLDLEIPLPPLAEQRRLVARIDTLAAKIDEAKRLRDEVVGTSRSMLLSAYTEMTATCPALAMREVAPQVRRPVDPLAGVEYHELGIRSFGKGSFHKPPLDGGSVGTKKLYEIHPGDVVFNNVFAWEGAVAVAKPEDAGRVGSHRFITCVPKPNVATAEYINFHFSTRLGLAQLGEASPGGAGRNRTLGLEALARIVIPVPPFAAQLWFGELLKKCQHSEGERTTADAELNAMLPAILDRAFRGEL